MTSEPTTDDIGLGIRDALELLDGIHRADDPDADPFTFDHVDDSDPSNLRLVTGGAVFIVRVIREA